VLLYLKPKDLSELLFATEADLPYWLGLYPNLFLKISNNHFEIVDIFQKSHPPFRYNASIASRETIAGATFFVDCNALATILPLPLSLK
jgi:hypothetical protein